MKKEIMHGIFLYIIAIFMIVSMNAFAKLASATYHPFEIVFYRNIIGLIAIALFLTFRKNWSVLKTTNPKAHLSRGLIGTLSVIFVFSAHKYLPMADATALMYAAPLIITALSGTLLKERVGIFRWLAVVVGFIGVLIIAKPSGGGSLIGYGFAFVAAFTVAAVSLSLRHLGKTEDPVATVFYFLLTGAILTGMSLPFIGISLQKDTLWILVCIAIAGTCQQFLKTKAFVLAPAATLASLQFTGILWGVLFGLFMFDDWPTPNVWVGGILVVASNLFIIWRERKK